VQILWEGSPPRLFWNFWQVDDLSGLGVELARQRSPCSPTQFGAARSGALHPLPLLFRLFRMPWRGRLGRGNDDREREGIRRDEVAGLDFGPVR
jgi:hypothetical protein